MAENLVKDIDDLDLKLDLEKPLSNISIISENREYYKGFIKWHITKSQFENYLSNVGGNHQSDWFYFGKKSCFYFTLYPCGRNESLKNYVSLTVNLSGTALPPSAWIGVTLSIDGRKIFKNFSAGGSGPRKDINIDKFDETINLWNSISENDLTIQCSTEILVRDVECKHDKKSVCYKEPSNKCDRYRERLFMDKKFSDVTFRLEGKEIKAHKVILIEVPYFEKEKTFVDDPNQIIDLPNIKYDIFENILRYIYTGDIPMLNFRLASELYVIANTMEIFSIKHVCSSYLGANLTTRNVLIVLKLSHECKDNQLKKECFVFIKESDIDLLTTDAVVL